MPNIFSRLMWSTYLAYHLRGQSQFPFQSLSTIEQAQSRRVQQMINYAFRYVPYYRETMKRLNLSPNDFNDAKDLRRLPIIERQQLHNDPEYFISEKEPKERYLKLFSGGSTGEPRTIYHNTAAIFQNSAHSFREQMVMNQHLNRATGYRATFFSVPKSSVESIQQYTQRYAFFPKNLKIKKQFLCITSNTDENIAAINEFKPDLFCGYGSYFEELFPYVYRHKLELHRPKAILYGADSLSHTVRELIKNEFKIPVLSTYQAIEAFKIGFECEQGLGLHLNIDLYPVDIVNSKGELLPIGESGELIVSNLVNGGTVLLNYRLGDIAQILSESCPCHRTLPLLSFPQGRTDDWITMSSGRRVHPQTFRNIFRYRSTIWQYQIKYKYDHFNIAIVTKTENERENIIEGLTKDFKKEFGENIELSFNFVEAMPRTAGGKTRIIIAE